ncbi:MAG: hypothetical protein LBP80_04360 [Treponema sp.]|jgi:hypothetical protein|nr:hypothetical protein [Treponema sp.]
MKGKTKLSNTAAKFADFWRSPAERDLSKTIISTLPVNTRRTGGLAAAPLLRAIYTGAAQDFNLASGFTYPAIAVPKQLAGVPVIGEGHGELQNYLLDEGPVITQTMLVTGTAWRWARWNDKLRRLVWEIIPDDAIGSQGIETDPDTGEILVIRTDENIEFNGPDFRVHYARRKRVISREMITEEWTGEINRFTQYRNPFGFMPVPFGHDCWESDWRGQSVYGRIIRLIADNHDIRRTRDETLAMFRPKMIQTSPNPDQWLVNNKQYTDAAEGDKYSPFKADFVINAEGEKTEYISIGSDATRQHTEAIQENNKEIMIASGLPELLFGGLATGNYASTDSQIRAAVEYVKEIQREMTRPYQQLLNQSAHILSYMKFEQPGAIEVKWGTLDMTSPEQRARIIGTFAAAISTLLSNGSVSKEGALYFTKLMFEDYPAEDAAQYLAGINEMLTEHSSHVGQQLFEDGDMGGLDMEKLRTKDS